VTEKAPPSATSKGDSLVTASVTVDRPKLGPGDLFTLRIVVHIEPEWHIYAIDRPTGPSIPTAIKFQLPKALAWDGDWTTSEPALDDAHPEEPSFIYTESASFSRRVRVAKDAPPGTLVISGSLHYQACNRSLCRAPTQVPLQAQVTIAP
jgi:Disulphide bond corrector protein DsbC